MLIFETILPVFLIVIFGFLFRKFGPVSESFWPEFNSFGYYVLFPALIFHAILTADFSQISFGYLTLLSLIAFSAMPCLVLLSWPIFQKMNIAKPSFTTFFQTTSRWHGFMSLAIAEKLYGSEGLTFVAIIMLIVIVPINLVNVIVLVSFDGKKHSFADFATQIVTNPIILAALLGITINLSGLHIYPPISQGIDFIARSSLGLGLLMIGAGLRLRDMVVPNGLILLPTIAKLIIQPIIAYVIGSFFGFEGQELILIVLCCAVPAATNGYVLAQKLGGDVPLYASTLSFQIVMSFFTIPIVLLLVGAHLG